MNLDLNYFAGQDIPVPSMPAKPTLPYPATSEQALEYAYQLQNYENLVTEYHICCDEYHQQLNSRMDKLKFKLRTDYGITQAQFDLLWDRAQECGDQGLHTVVLLFDDLYELASEFAELSTEACNA